MGAGILIDYNDGRPAMEITAGLRAPSFCGQLTTDTTAEVDSGGGGVLTFSAPSTAGSDVMFLPTQTVFILTFSVMPEIYYITSVSRQDTNTFAVAFASRGGTRGRLVRFAGIAAEILPASVHNAGLLVSNSTDFTAIPNNSSLMTCAFRGTVTVNGDMALPVQGVPFGRWDNPNVSVSFDGGSIIVRDISYQGRDDVKGSVTMDLVIFSQAAPTPGPGITMTNSAGQVTFSTTKPPFLYQSQIVLNDNAQGIGNSFCQICCTGTQTRMIEGYANVRVKGVVMAGQSVRSAFNRVNGNYFSSGWDSTFNNNIAVPLTLLPGFY